MLLHCVTYLQQVGASSYQLLAVLSVNTLFLMLLFSSPSCTVHDRREKGPFLASFPQRFSPLIWSSGVDFQTTPEMWKTSVGGRQTPGTAALSALSSVRRTTMIFTDL